MGAPVAAPPEGTKERTRTTARARSPPSLRPNLRAGGREQVRAGVALAELQGANSLAASG